MSSAAFAQANYTATHADLLTISLADRTDPAYAHVDGYDASIYTTYVRVRYAAQS